MSDLLARLHVNQGTAAPKSHQTVGLVERANAEIRKYLRLYEPGENWDLVLRQMMHAFNSAWCVSINMSPAEVMFGRKFYFPDDLRIQSEESRLLSLPEWERSVAEKRLLAAESEKKAKRAMAEKFEAQRSKGRDKEKLKVGDFVLLDSQDSSLGYKNRPAWKGPFLVKDVSQDGLRVVVDVGEGMTLTRGAKYFKKYISRGRLEEVQPWIVLGEDGELAQTRLAPAPSTAQLGARLDHLEGADRLPSVDLGPLPRPAGAESDPENRGEAGEMSGPVESDSAMSIATGFDAATSATGTAPEEMRANSTSASQVARLSIQQQKLQRNRKSRSSKAGGGLVTGTAVRAAKKRSVVEGQEELDSAGSSGVATVSPTPAVASAADLGENPDVFDVGDVLAVRDTPSGREYRIDWEGFGPEFRTWEREQNLPSAIIAESKNKWRYSLINCTTLSTSWSSRR